MKRLILLSLCLLLAALLAQGCAPAEDARAAAFYLGTYVEFRSRDWGAQSALDAAMNEVARIEAVMDFAKDGDIAAVNAGAGTYVPVGKETFDLISTALYVCERSGGAFNPLALPALRLWGLEHGAPEYRVPSDAERAAILPLMDYTRVSLNAEACAVRIDEGMALDLGGIAKGYAGERAQRELEQRRVRNAIMELGGDVVTMGTRADGQPYRVGIRHPREQDAVLISLPLSNKAIVTSGDYERFFERDGVRYHHIIDPATGAPSRSGLVSVTIIAQSCTLADALSTAVFVLGADKGLAMLDTMEEDVDAVLVDEQRNVYATPGVRGTLAIHDDAYILR